MTPAEINAAVMARNAHEFIKAYQERHMLVAPNPRARTQAYWNWRSGWLTECLHHLPDWGKHQTMTLRNDKVVAVGHEHVNATYFII